MKRKTSEKRFLNRELSWLEFNQRVLDEAANPDVPLLERLKFLAITASNLSEFFMVRVGGLSLLTQHRITKRDPSGMTPRQQLDAIAERAGRMVNEQYDLYCKVLEPALAQAGIQRICPHLMNPEQKTAAEKIFQTEIAPVITPMAVESGKPFPLLANLMLCMAVQLEPDTDDKDQQDRFAIIPLGGSLRRFHNLPGTGGSSFALLEDISGMFVERLFPGLTVKEYATFMVTRNADLSVRDEFAQDLLSEMEDILRARAKSDAVRLEITNGVSRGMLSFLRKELGLTAKQIYVLNGPPALNDFMQMTSIQGYDDLRYETWIPQPSPIIDPQQTIFENIEKHPVLLHHPYESFDPVIRLIQEAADDPHVMAIKQILYRTSSKSPIVDALIRAAGKGKYVTVIVELKARFDEARNIDWARRMEETGVQVIYGVRGFKTHAKVCIIVRKDPLRGVERYVHIGTGNYNEATARLYTDVGCLSKDPELGADASAFFNAITGYSQPGQYRRLYAAPISLRARLLELINGEAARARQGQKTYVKAKVNSLVDPAIIEALYSASCAGVKIQLMVRGICCLVPGVKGLSENITVVSVIDRFLEHSRIFCFCSGGDNIIMISSADWMPRNLDRRCELMLDVSNETMKKRLLEILECGINDNVKGKLLQSDGTYLATTIKKRSQKRLRSQEELYTSACLVVEEQRQTGRTVFRPHRPA